MAFERLQLIYFSILLGLFVLTNQLLLFILVFLIKMVYFINMESDNDYIFDYGFIDYEDVGVKYLDYDIDDEFFYTLMHEESYLVSSCRFFFDLYGGEMILDHIDFIDFNIYKISDNRNFKYIYVNIQTYKNFLNNNYNEIYNMKQFYINNNNSIFNINKLDEIIDNEIYINNIYNIINNIENSNIIKYKLRDKLLVQKK
jgi:hypothetical protein